MKLLISNPDTGCNKIVEIDSDTKLRAFFDKRVSEEVPGDFLGDEYKGYIFKITGGQDKEGFPMKQGVLTNGRVRLLIPRGTTGFQAWRGRSGERRRKSIRGCIVGPDLSVLQLAIVKKGDGELPGLTEEARLRTFGPKRASKIRRLFNLPKNEDVRKHVIKHKKTIGKKADAKTYFKGPKIQRLVTPDRLHRKRQLQKRKIARRTASKAAKTAFAALVVKRAAETKKAEPTTKAAETKTAAPAKAAPVKAAPVKAAPVKAAPVQQPKQAAPAKQAAPQPVKQAAPAKQAAPVKQAAPAPAKQPAQKPAAGKGGKKQ